ncbi:DUF262 domain-containing protein [Synechocystis sp. LKSZ1]|uniref:DUF262 domain-containing protein n=1 Tax=Synechocystis sp. LKSZ1 TaxID=3144951 RepID=UPI00336BC12D
MTSLDTQESRIVELINAVDNQIKKVHTQSLDISFNELLDMYKSGELNINPDYQRLFQWSEGARSRFIESLLLEMPVPPIYVIEESDGKYMLIDGLQRISSYLHLRGELEAEHLDPPIHRGEKLILRECDIVQELNGKTFDHLGTALQIRLKRAFVRVEVVRKGSDPKFRYHMFKRLNTGGLLLTHQQLRNCTIRLLDPTFNDFIINLSKEAAFRECIMSLNQERVLEAYDQELVLRFFALKNYRDKFEHDVADFLTEYMEAVSEPDLEKRLSFNYEQEKDIFCKTFLIFQKTLGEYAFAAANRARETLTRGFAVYHFEAFTIGLQPYLEQLDPSNDVMIENLENTFRSIKCDEQFVRMTTGGGKNSRGLLRDRIDFVKDRIQSAI